MNYANVLELNVAAVTILLSKYSEPLQDEVKKKPCSFIYKSTIRPCMEYCCHAWAGALGYCLDMLDKLQKRKCRTVGPVLCCFS